MLRQVQAPMPLLRLTFVILFAPLLATEPSSKLFEPSPPNGPVTCGPAGSGTRWVLPAAEQAAATFAVRVVLVAHRLVQSES